ncbi:MAG: 5'-nucleotidase C-terminal domain-containing protein [Chitinophagaceae bacterium]|nr:5'-nucleotidase C-terminal domain-containing protein [Chitinophagaceae bacterium]
MKKYSSAILLFFFSILLQFSCHTPYRTEKLIYSNYRLSQETIKDSSTIALLKPYSEEVSRTMNDVVGTIAVSMDKAQPESALGDWMADAYLAMAKEKFKRNVDGAMMNFGGIRLTQIPAGPITRGKVFELMPFDNLLILQEMTGAQVQQLLDLIAARNGWPLAGITMEIKEKKAVNIWVGGKQLDPSATYTIANSDFVANGGDEAAFLKSIPQINIGYLMRDALFDYINTFTKAGKPITAPAANRVRYAQ